jgi:opacity protein-like surface antigen
MRRGSAGLVLLAALVAGSAAVAEAGSHIYVSPTIGIWKWDKNAASPFALSGPSRLVIGARAGYSPIEAFAGEIVFLTGTAKAHDGSPDTTLSLRQNQLELSLLVNFQSLMSSRVYPFLDLGAGAAFRSGGGTVDGRSVFEETRFVFHLGGGLKVDLTPRLSLRSNVRDTFFTETQGAGNVENQVTVDSVELSLGAEYRFPLARTRGPKRLR